MATSTYQKKRRKQIRLVIAMAKTRRNSCWHEDSDTVGIIDSGIKRGLVERRSETRVEWTMEGHTMLRTIDGEEVAKEMIRQSEACVTIPKRVLTKVTTSLEDYQNYLEDGHQNMKLENRGAYPCYTSDDMAAMRRKIANNLSLIDSLPGSAKPVGMTIEEVSHGVNP